MPEKEPYVSMTRRERISGLIFLPFYLFLLSHILAAFANAAHVTSSAVLNLIFYVICTAVVLAIFSHFLGSSLYWFRRVPKNVLCQAGANLLMYYAAAITVSLLISAVVPDFANRNNDTLTAVFADYPVLLCLIALLMAPLIEECIFRGLIFGSLTGFSRIGAYLVTMAAFSAVHILPYWNVLSPLELLCSFAQYAPAALFLCRAYEKSGTVLGSILMHSTINLISVLVLYVLS